MIDTATDALLLLTPALVKTMPSSGWVVSPSLIDIEYLVGEVAAAGAAVAAVMTRPRSMASPIACRLEWVRRPRAARLPVLMRTVPSPEGLQRLRNRVEVRRES
jgi:hypothetical protein